MTKTTGRMLGLIAVLALVSAASLAVWADPVKAVARACAADRLKESVNVSGYLFRSYESDADGESCFEVLQQGKVIFRRTNDNDGWFALGQKADKEEGVPAIPNGTDVTGRGYPDMIVSGYLGGMHCCHTHYVFELEPRFRLIATFDDGDNYSAHFEREGKAYYYESTDGSFQGFWMTEAGSPSHSVVLHFIDDRDGGGFHLAKDKMQTPAPTPKQWQHALDDVRDSLSGVSQGDLVDAPNILWQDVLNLIYTSHSDLVMKFLKEVGPRAQQKPLPNLEYFCSVLKGSPYWDDLEPTLSKTMPACVIAPSGP